MAFEDWKATQRSVATLALDPLNPRLVDVGPAPSPKQIIQSLFDHDEAMDIAESIAKNGFFPNEPLLALKEGSRTRVVEGNRRLAALKALKDPRILTEPYRKKIQNLIKKNIDADRARKVPVVIAPNRYETDAHLYARHTGKQLHSPWKKRNRSKFILEKISEDYSPAEMEVKFGVTAADIREAKEFAAMTDIVASIPLSPLAKSEVQNPRTKIYSAIERVWESPNARKAIGINKDDEHGFTIHASREKFERSMAKLVEDVANGSEDTRTLGTAEGIARWLEKIPADDRPKGKGRTLTPQDFKEQTEDNESSTEPTNEAPKKPKPTKRLHTSVIPSNFKNHKSDDRLIKLRSELVGLNRNQKANAGAVLLRVFLERSMIFYLKQESLWTDFIKDLKAKNQLRHGQPTMKSLSLKFAELAKKNLSTEDYKIVARGLRYNEKDVHNLCDLNAFVHSEDMPTGEDILQIWNRLKPLFEMMLSEE